MCLKAIGMDKAVNVSLIKLEQFMTFRKLVYLTIVIKYMGIKSFLLLFAFKSCFNSSFTEI